MTRLRAGLQEIFSATTMSARQVARTAGLLISVSKAMSAARLYTRALYAHAKTAHQGGKKDWDLQMIVSDLVKQDAQWLHNNLQRFNGRSMWPQKISMILTTDASKLAGNWLGGGRDVEDWKSAQRTDPTFRASPAGGWPVAAVLPWCPLPWSLLSVARPAVRRPPCCPLPALLSVTCPAVRCPPCCCPLPRCVLLLPRCVLLLPRWLLSIGLAAVLPARLTADRCWETSAKQGKIFHHPYLVRTSVTFSTPPTISTPIISSALHHSTQSVAYQSSVLAAVPSAMRIAMPISTFTHASNHSGTALPHIPFAQTTGRPRTLPWLPHTHHCLPLPTCTYHMHFYSLAHATVAIPTALALDTKPVCSLCDRCSALYTLTWYRQAPSAYPPSSYNPLTYTLQPQQSKASHHGAPFQAVQQ